MISRFKHDFSQLLPLCTEHPQRAVGCHQHPGLIKAQPCSYLSSQPQRASSRGSKVADLHLQSSASLSFLISHWLPFSNMHFLFVLSRSLSLVVCILNPSDLSLSKVFAPCHQPACCSPLKPQAWPGTMASLGGTHPAVWLARWQRDAPILGQ